VTHRASHRGVLAVERIGNGGVVFHAEDRGFPALHGVARGALATIGAGDELAMMGILVTIRTFGVGNRSLEVALLVAVAAGDRSVFAHQGKIRLRMIETFELSYAFPVCRVVTGLARCREAAFVRVGVAGRALVKGKPGVFDVGLGIRNGHMAFGAGKRSVRAGELEFRGAVVESGGRLPSGGSVAARTVGSNLPMVLVRMATGAISRKAKVGVVEVFDDDARSRGSGNVSGLVAAFAG